MPHHAISTPAAPANRLPLHAALAMAAVFGPALAFGPIGAGRDPLALVMVALTGFVALIVTGFATRYMRADRARNRFGRDLGLVVGCVLATVTAGNVLVLALGWIGSGQALARLIGHDRNWPQARAAARLARLTFAVGDAALVLALARRNGAGDAGAGREGDEGRERGEGARGGSEGRERGEGGWWVGVMEGGKGRG